MSQGEKRNRGSEGTLTGTTYPEPEPIEERDEDQIQSPSRNLTHDLLFSSCQSDSPEGRQISLILMRAFSHKEYNGVYKLRGEEAQAALDIIQDVSIFSSLADDPDIFRRYLKNTFRSMHP